MERIGRIKLLNKEKGYGFIATATSDVYFKLRELQNVVDIGDEVAYLHHEGGDKVFARAVRKIYKDEGGNLFIPRINSFHLHVGVEQYLPDLIRKFEDLSEEFIIRQFDFAFPIGKTQLVKTTPADNIVYAIRRGRLGHTRFVRNKEPKDCASITMILKRVPSHFVIISCFIGSIAEPEPWDAKATLKSLKFWKEHALIWGCEEVISESCTEVCPWILNQQAISRVKRRPREAWLIPKKGLS